MADALIPAPIGTALPVGDWRRWLGLAVLLAAVFVSTLDNFIVFVAMPSIRADLGASFAQAEFIVAGYTLTFAVGMITSGRLGDKVGRRLMFMIGFAAFTIASVLCGMAHSPQSLIAYRIIQGVSSAVLSPQVLAIIRVTFSDPRERATAFGWMGVAIGLGGVLGQVVGGIVVSANLFGLGWRPVFLLNLPIGALALILTPFVITESRASGVQRLDPLGAVLSALGLGLLLFPLIEGREAGWPSWSFAMLGASIVTLGLFTAHQHGKSNRKDAPLLDTELFRDRTFVVGLVVILLFYATIAPMILSFSYLVQVGFGGSPLASALYFSPLAITFAISSLVAGRLTRSGARRVLAVGATITSIGTAAAWLTCTIVPAFGPVNLVAPMMVIGLGQGLFMTPVINAVLSGIPEHHTGAASGVLTTMQRVGSALGVAIFEIPFFVTLNQARAMGTPESAAYTAAFGSVTLWLFVTMVIVLALLALLPSGRSQNPAP